MSLQWIIIAIFALPVAELVAFIVVAAEIGALSAVGLQLAISAVGYLLLRQVGSARWSRLKTGVAAPGVFVRTLGSSKGALVLAGILLLIPGFITDVVGAAVLVPPLRRRLAAWARGAIAPAPHHRARPDAVIDLAPDEWRDITKPSRPKRKARRRG
jgi:UPF0716 protein FxsA